MQREIKFRAWHKALNKMLTPNEWHHYGPKIVSGELISHDHELMQFTGLTDKNGKEIYEGDIAKTHTDKPMVVSYSSRFASFCLTREGWAFVHYFGEALEAVDCEVIGNIYENPELLNN